MAGTAPPARTADSTSSAAARLSGRGSPWASRVLSSATTGRPARSASATSGERTGAEGEGCTLSSWRAGAVAPRSPVSVPAAGPPDEQEYAVSQSDILERPDVREGDTGNANEVFHYVRKNKIAESAVMGTLVEALCGEVFPVTKSPKPGSPVCPACKEVYEQLKK